MVIYAAGQGEKTTKMHVIMPMLAVPVVFSTGLFRLPWRVVKSWIII